MKEHKPIRYKIVNGKRRPICDYHGKCKNLAYKEVYPGLMGGIHGDKGWNYLCRKHFKQEKKFYRGKLPYVSLDKKDKK